MYDGSHRTVTTTIPLMTDMTVHMLVKRRTRTRTRSPAIPGTTIVTHLLRHLRRTPTRTLILILIHLRHKKYIRLTLIRIRMKWIFTSHRLLPTLCTRTTPTLMWQHDRESDVRQALQEVRLRSFLPLRRPLHLLICLTFPLRRYGNCRR